MKQEISEYLERIKSQYGYSDEQLEYVRQFRENPDLEHMEFETFTALHVDVRIVCRTRKLKKKRNLYTDGEKIFYLNHWSKQYEFCGYFYTQEFLDERSEKERLEREATEQRRTAKAEAKRLKREAERKQTEKKPSVKSVYKLLPQDEEKNIQITVKPKRKRIIR